MDFVELSAEVRCRWNRQGLLDSIYTWDSCRRRLLPPPCCLDVPKLPKHRAHPCPIMEHGDQTDQSREWERPSRGSWKRVAALRDETAAWAGKTRELGWMTVRGEMHVKSSWTCASRATLPGDELELLVQGVPLWRRERNYYSHSPRLINLAVGGQPILSHSYST